MKLKLPTSAKAMLLSIAVVVAIIMIPVAAVSYNIGASTGLDACIAGVMDGVLKRQLERKAI